MNLNYIREPPNSKAEGNVNPKPSNIENNLFQLQSSQAQAAPSGVQGSVSRNRHKYKFTDIPLTCVY